MLVNTYHLILSLQDFSPDNSAAGFFYGMDGEIFLAGGFRMVIVGTLLRVSFILCGTVCYGCSHRYFFFFLFLWRWFGSRLFHRYGLEQFVQSPAASPPEFGYGNSIRIYFDRRRCRRDGAFILSLFRLVVLAHLFEYSHKNDTCYQEKFQKIFNSVSLLNS